MVFKKRQNIGKIVKSNNSDNILSETSPWGMQEAYKVLRTNVLFSLPGEGSRIIAVTSAFANDGKSTNAINLAISMGKLNKKVLLIDCDMRKPSIGTMLGIKSIPGLSDILVGLERLGAILQHVKKLQIDVIAAGNIPPDPTLLLQGNTMRNLLKAAKDEYDYIILDFPPVTTVTDAVLLSSIVDGYLIVVRHERTDYRAVMDTVEQMRFAKANIIGFIYNDYSQEKGMYSYRYRKYRRYAYEYGYGDAGRKEDDEK